MTNPKGTTLSIILFGEEWTDMWRRRQQLAAKLAEFDVVDKVVYVEQPLTLYSLVKYLLGKGKHSARVSWRRVFRHRSLVHQINDKLYVITPLTLLPWLNSRLLIALDHPFRFHIQARLIKRSIANLGIDNIVLWIGMPTIPIELVHLFNQKLTWYDYTDDYRAEPSLPPFFRRLIAQAEDYLLSHADVVSIVSRRSYQQKMGVNKNSYWLPNAVDTELFISPSSPECPEDMKTINPPRLGYIGEINAKFDLELLEYLAQSRPAWSVVLIGNVDLPGKSVSRLKAYPSIHFQGRKPYHSLPAYLQNIDLGIHLYKQEEIGNNKSIESDQKIFLYLAAGKPVVVFFPAGMEGVHQGLVQYFTTREEFVAGIEDALATDSVELKRRRIEYAQVNSWRARAEQIVTIIAQNPGGL
ncbi:hypothetical protein ACFLTY_01265 [Chloroflexota bacterium]